MPDEAHPADLPIGSIAVKAAWRELTDADSPAVRARYYVVRDAEIVDVGFQPPRPPRAVAHPGGLFAGPVVGPASLSASIHSRGSWLGTNNGCGNTQISNVPTVADPYAGLAANIPADSCGGSYPQEPAKKKDPALPAANQWSGTYSLLTGAKVVCGDQQLVGNTTINNTTLVIENGQLDTKGYTLTGSGLTVVFSGFRPEVEPLTSPRRRPAPGAASPSTRTPASPPT